MGIDSPDFTLNIEMALRSEGILTAHYVSPSVWAWRQGRVVKIAKAIDRMLTLFPFEAQFYNEHNVPVSFVGHPLADEFPIDPDQAAARQILGMDGDGPSRLLKRRGGVSINAAIYALLCQPLILSVIKSYQRSWRLKPKAYLLP